MFQSDTINIYARRVKTPKYSRVFWVPLNLGASIISTIKPHRPNILVLRAGFQNLWTFLSWSFLWFCPSRLETLQI